MTGRHRKLASLIRATLHSYSKQKAGSLDSPDDGKRAWMQVAMAWFVVFCTWGYVNSFGSFQTYYSENFSYGSSTISWIGSVQVWLTFFIGAFSGRLLDAGFFRSTFLVGSILQLLGILLMSFSKQYWHLMLTQGVLTGIGGGLIFCPAMALLASYFTKDRALAVGVATTGNSVGGMIYPVVARELLPELGFAWTVRIIALLNLACLILPLIYMRPKIPPRTAGPVVDWSALRDPVFMLFIAGLFLALWSVYYVFYYIGSYGAEVLSLPYSSSAIVIMFINGIGVPPRIIVPLLADRVGALNIIVPVALCMAVVTYAWLAIETITGYYVFACLFGIVNAAFQCLMPTAIASLTPELDLIGARLGLAFSCLSFATLTGPPIGGVLHGARAKDFVAAQIWAATSIFVASLLLLASRVKKAGWNLKTVV